MNNIISYLHRRVVCILCAYTLEAAADSKEYRKVPICVLYIGRYTTTTWGRSSPSSSRNRLGEQNPDETKTDRIKIIRVEKKVFTQLYEYPYIMCKRWNRPKIVVGTDIYRLISRSTSDEPICPGSKAKHKIDWKTHYCGLYTTTAAALFLQYNILIWRLIFRLQPT